MFQNITESTILSAALKTKGSSGPSGIDADGWRRNQFLSQRTSQLLHVKFAGNVRTKGLYIRDWNHIERWQVSHQPGSIFSLSANTFRQNPRICPIGIGEVLRGIVGNAILSVIKPEVISSVGNLQPCGGREGGCEAAVHAMKDIFNAQSTDAVLLVDADNAFNSLNRAVLLPFVYYLCPHMAIYIRNCYSTPSSLFFLLGTEVSSSEDNTRRSPCYVCVRHRNNSYNGSH